MKLFMLSLSLAGSSPASSSGSPTFRYRATSGFDRKIQFVGERAGSPHGNRGRANP